LSYAKGPHIMVPCTARPTREGKAGLAPKEKPASRRKPGLASAQEAVATAAQ